jgi:hypothetical protein
LTDLSDLRLIEQSARWLTASLYLVTLIQQIRWRNYLTAPMFCWYLLLMLIQRVWNPQTIWESIFTEPWAVSLRLCCVVEALSLCIPRERHKERQLAALLLLITGCAAVEVLIYFSHLWGVGMSMVYTAVRQYFHVGLCAGCFMAIVYYQIESVKLKPIPRSHFLILFLHLTVIAGIGFLRFGKGEGRGYREAHIWYYAGSSVCLVLWLRMRRLLPTL